MKTFILVLSSSLLLSSFAFGEDDISTARSIPDRCLAMLRPIVSETDRYGSPAVTESTQARIARIAVLAELKKTPHGAVISADEILFDRATPEQRQEIVSALGDYNTIGTNDRRQAVATILLAVNACMQNALIKKEEKKYWKSYLIEFVSKES